jgi:hypothetical protein
VAIESGDGRLRDKCPLPLEPDAAPPIIQKIFLVVVGWLRVHQRAEAPKHVPQRIKYTSAVSVDATRGSHASWISRTE